MMKRSIILWLFLIYSFRIPSELFASYYVCIDPGHGGIYSGAVGPVYGVLEKNANLTVGLALKSKIEFYVAPVLMTRTTDETLYLDVRAEMAKDSGVSYFISIHHNGSTDTSVNGTETYFCNAEYTDSGEYRGVVIMYGARDSTLAKKVRLVLRDSLHLAYRCSPQHLCGDTTKPCCMTCFDVLRNTTMQSVLSEASFITNPWVEYQFKNNTAYINKEASAICAGWWSGYLQGGIAIIRNAYSTGLTCGYGGVVGVGDIPWSIDTVDSPHEACWLMTSIHYLKAVSPQYINGYSYTFHHWTHFLPSGELFGTHNDPSWDIMVPAEFDYHRYVAYFTGGPFSTRLASPNGWETWSPGDPVNITWAASTSYGADSTTLVDVYLDRHNGSTAYPETICTSIPRKYSLSYSWTVTSPLSDSCRIKIVAHDVAGNQTYDISDYMFSIKGSSVTLMSPNGGENWEAGSTHQITWTSYRFGGLVKISYTKDGDTTWTIIASPYNTGTYNWTLPNSGYNLTQCRIKLEHPAQLAPPDMSDNFFTITPGPLSAPAISAQRDCYGYIPGILVSWPDNNVNELGYKIERKDSISAWQEVAITAINGTNFRNRNLRGSEVYFYQIRAYNQARYSAYSNVVSMKSPPNLPSNYTAYVYTGTAPLSSGFSTMIEPNATGPPPEPGHPTNAVILHWGAPSNQKLPIRYYRIMEEWYENGWIDTYPTPRYGYGDTLCPLQRDFYYYFYVYAVDSQGDACSDCRARSDLLHTGLVFACGHPVAKLATSIPKEFSLSQNFPNPFNPQTEINFNIPEPAFVCLKIYNILGQVVQTLVNQRMEAGFYSVTWNGVDENTNGVSSGIYFYRIQAGKFSQIRKMILMK